MSQSVDLLCITAHPDDVELCAGGTVAKHVDSGRTVGIVDLTRGELGTRGNAEIRSREAEQARQLLGAAFRYQLDLPDGFFDVDDNSLLRVVRVIREHRPSIIITNALWDRHPDHGQGAALVKKAAFLSGLIKVDTDQEAWRPELLLHGIQDRQMPASLVIDITDHFDRKMEAIMAFGSQFYDPDSDEPESPISSKQFMELIRGRAMEFGRSIGADYGEGFVVERPIGVNDLAAIR